MVAWEWELELDFGWQGTIADVPRAAFVFATDSARGISGIASIGFGRHADVYFYNSMPCILHARMHACIDVDIIVIVVHMYL
jgi:hypothetical protein